MLREIVKWDYELRNGEQLDDRVDRALAIAATEPRGPVYLSLPREVIAAPASVVRLAASHACSPAAPRARRGGDRRGGGAPAGAAKRPLIVTSNAARDPAAFAALGEFAERFAMPVVQHRPRYLSLPSSHPMNLGFDPGRMVPHADVILVIESDVPWIPSLVAPAADCQGHPVRARPAVHAAIRSAAFPATSPSPGRPFRPWRR